MAKGVFSLRGLLLAPGALGAIVPHHWKTDCAGDLVHEPKLFQLNDGFVSV